MAEARKGPRERGGTLEPSEARADKPSLEAAPIPLTGDTEWINECFPVHGRHEHVSVFLVRAPEGNVVVDSGSFYHRQSIERRLWACTGERGLQAIILSHTDYPHAGNVSAFRREWGDIDIIASSGAPEIQGLPYATKSSIGGTLSVRGREFSFLDPPLADRSHTSWIYDRVSGVLYTADGFGSYHEPGECARTSKELPEGIPAESIYAYHRDALSWLRYVDPARLAAKLASIFERFEVSFVAPVHGTPIAASDLPEYLEHLVEAAGRISREYRVPSP